jgi:putative SOS response-associated peptidase YedK
LFETGDELFAFAGLWRESDGVRVYTLLTSEPNKVVKEYHHRMPVILPKKAYAAWFDANSTPEELQGLLVPWAGKMTATAAPKPKADMGEAVAKPTKGKSTKGK